MKTFRCPACANKVSYEADVCFDCGQPLTDDIKDQAEKKHYAKQGCWLVVILAWTIYSFWPASKPEAPNMSKAVAFDVVKVSEQESFNRKRIYIDIAIPTYQQNTPEQYAQTVMQAAWLTYGALKKTEPDHPAKVFVAQFAPYKDMLLAKATFSIDKKGWGGDTDLEWEVVTLDRKLPPEEYFQTAELWWNMRDDYQIPNPDIQGDTMTDEDALRSAIAEKLHIPFEMVHLPVITTSEYYKK